jgi:hypothetical protein
MEQTILSAKPAVPLPKEWPQFHMKRKFIIIDFFMQKLIPFDVVLLTPMDALQSGLLLGLLFGGF